jgi:integrative and conjugative element protein (TIGR02256 family)
VKIDLKKIFYDYVSKYHKNWEKNIVIIGLEIPKTRISNGQVESVDHFAFYVDATLNDIAKKMDILTNETGTWQPFILIGQNKSPILPLDDIQVKHWRIQFILSKKDAQKISKLEIETNPSIFLVGAGSLGSHVAINLSRQGFGNWTICDEDRLLPHNFSRHGLPYHYLGYKKASALTDIMNGMFDGHDNAIAIFGMFSENAKNSQKEYTQKFDVLMDFSASDSVMNLLSLPLVDAPYLSGFVNPTAEIGVILYEGKERQTKLDDIYQQFFTQIAVNSDLKHYFMNADKIITYAGACRDLAFRVSGDLISLQAAAMSAFIRTHLNDKKPSIHLWMWQSKNMTLKHKRIKIYPTKIFTHNNWTIKISQAVLTEIDRLRKESSPKETGGVLLGKFDLINKKIYVSYCLSAPPDSIMEESCFIRGNKGLQREIDRICNETKLINYVGEWHTHPVGNSHIPSQQDKKTLKCLKEILSSDLLPTLMVIKGDEAKPYIEVCE